MTTKTINLYTFEELSDEAKEKAIDTWYENEDYPFLTDDLRERICEVIKENGCTYVDSYEGNGITPYYSLSHSQGDGLCFEGTIEKDGYSLTTKHKGHYYYASSVEMTYTNPEGEEVESIGELMDTYYKACKDAETQGYDTLEYRMNNDEFAELCESNGYTFLENGVMENA